MDISKRLAGVAAFGFTFLGLSGWQILAQEAPCVAPDSWTSHAAVPAPDNNADFATNCDFHLWSWNMFLWMTQEDSDGDRRFENFATLDELFNPNPSNADFAELSLEKSLVLSPRALKPRDISGSTSRVAGIDGFNQAGSLGVLVRRGADDPNSGRAVYYSINVDPVYYEFIRDNKYYDVATYQAADPGKNFDVGSVEFKYSWIVVEEGEDVSTFFTVDAQIVELTTDSAGKVIADTSKQIPAKVALVGTHVVGVVKDHPEFIWATFEHVSNAPNLPAGIDPKADTAVSDKDWTFYAANTAAKDSNIIDGTDNLEFADQSKQTLAPVVNVFRQFAWGTDPNDPEGPENAANIQMLNNSVQSGTLAGGSVWQNYQLTGALWGDGDMKTNVPVTPIGSTKLSNATLETFTQSGANCLSCHGPYGKNMNISHIMKEHGQSN